MKLHYKIQALLLSAVLVILPLAGCDDTPEESSAKAMGRYIEEQWELPPGADYIMAQHIQPDGRIGVVNEKKIYSTSDGKDWREEDIPWMDKLINLEYIESIHYNSQGVAAIILFGQVPGDDPENQRYQIALGYPDGTLAYTPIGLSGDPWANDDQKVILASPSGSLTSPVFEASTDAEAVSGNESMDAQAITTDKAISEGIYIGEAAEEITSEDDMDDWFYVTNAVMGDDGYLYVASYFNAGRFDPETGELLTTYLDAYTFSKTGDTVVQLLGKDDAEYAGIDVDGYTLFYQDALTGEQKKQISAENLRSGNVALIGGEDGSLYIADRSGIYRIAQNGETWEKIVNGDLCSLSLPSTSISTLTPHGDNEFLVGYDANSESMLINYVYSADTPTMPSTELTIYSLTTNGTVSQAAGTFRQSNPNVLVNVRTAQDDGDNITGDDARRALNTELLAGNGPDLIIMNGLPMESYIEKGVLADLSDVVQPMIDAGELLPTVSETYKTDKGLFAVPTRISVPTLWGDSEILKTVGNLTDIADYSEAHPDIRMFANLIPKQLLYQFASTQWNGLFDTLGQLDTKNLEAYLTDIKRLADSADTPHLWSYFEEDEFQINTSDDFTDNMYFPDTEDVYGVAQSKSKLTAANLNGFESVMHPNGMICAQKGISSFNTGVADDWWAEAMSQMDQSELVDSFFPQPGSVSGVYMPQCVVGVNAASPNVGLAKEFVRAMLLPETQIADIGDGFPVNRTAIAANAQRQEQWYSAHTYTITNDENNESKAATEVALELEYGWPSQQMLQAVADMLEALDKPVIVDYDLVEMIANEAQPYFDGSITAAQAAEACSEKIRLRLAE